jgi:hypothetical protein
MWYELKIKDGGSRQQQLKPAIECISEMSSDFNETGKLKHRAHSWLRT